MGPRKKTPQEGERRRKSGTHRPISTLYGNPAQKMAPYNKIHGDLGERPLQPD